MQAPIITTGNELDSEKIIAFSKKVDIEQLLSYGKAVKESTVIDSFDADTIHLQFGGSLELGDIAKIEETNENDK